MPSKFLIFTEDFSEKEKKNLSGKASWKLAENQLQLGF